MLGGSRVHTEPLQTPGGPPARLPRLTEPLHTAADAPEPLNPGPAPLTAPSVSILSHPSRRAGSGGRGWEKGEGEGREKEKGPEAAVDLVPFLDSRGLGVEGASQGFRKSREGGFGAGGATSMLWGPLFPRGSLPLSPPPGMAGGGVCTQHPRPPWGCALRGVRPRPVLCGASPPCRPESAAGRGFSVFPGECPAPRGRALPTPGLGGGSAKRPQHSALVSNSPRESGAAGLSTPKVQRVCAFPGKTQSGLVTNRLAFRNQSHKGPHDPWRRPGCREGTWHWPGSARDAGSPGPSSARHPRRVRGHIPGAQCQRSEEQASLSRCGSGKDSPQTAPSAPSVWTSTQRPWTWVRRTALDLEGQRGGTQLGCPNPTREGSALVILRESPRNQHPLNSS